MTINFEDVGLWMRPWFRYFLSDIAQLLKERHGSRIHIYCGQAIEVPFYERLNAERKIFASVTHAGILEDHLLDPIDDAQAVIEKASSYEQLLKYTVNTLTFSNKHVGRAYSLAGTNFPRSVLSERTSHEQVLNAYNLQLDFWEKEIREKGLGLMINGPTEVAALMRARRIPYRFYLSSGYQNLHYWAWNEMMECPEFEWTANGVELDDDATATVDQPYAAVTYNRNRIIETTKGPWNLASNLSRTVIRDTYMRLRGLPRGYYLKDQLRYLYGRWRDLNRITRDDLPKLADLGDTPFVYYPLHREPELTFHQMTPEHFYQLSAIAGLSRDLPAGCKLVVKEHVSGIGRRPTEFYRQLQDFKNVVFMHALEPSLEIIQKAKAVATICGTAGIEATIMGVPVISFSQHNIYNFAPHVLVVQQEPDIARYLRLAINDKIDRSKARQDGARFLNAIQSVSFDLRGFDWKDMHSYDEIAVEDAYSHLIHGVKLEQQQAAQAAE